MFIYPEKGNLIQPKGNALGKKNTIDFALKGQFKK